MARLVPARAEGVHPAVALALALAVQRVHVGDPHVEDGLDGLADLGLVGVRGDHEGVHAFIEEGI